MNRIKGLRFTSKGMLALLLLAALLIGAVILNVSLNRKQDRTALEQKGIKDDAPSEEQGGDKPVGAGVFQNYFASFRDERSKVRAQEIDYLRMIINESGTDAETLQNAQLRLIELVDNMEREFSIESMIRTKGFLDAAVTFRNDAISVVISGETLTDEEVARILDIVKTETGAPASKIRISVSGLS